jgi:hypothetical protein
VGQFGSGWAWLVAEKGILKVVSTPDGDDPLPTTATPLLTLDADVDQRSLRSDPPKRGSAAMAQGRAPAADEHRQTVQLKAGGKA